ncbi:MAG: prepilin peptidase [Legionellales bacterium]|nr:prepilin peptidase [Legionellales bacterium]
MDLTLTEFFETYPIIFTISCIIGGMIIGSFINVVIYRVPLMLDHLARTECINFLEIKNDTEIELKSLNLFAPRSHCPKCKSTIKWFYNIPIVSYIYLKAKCGTCNNKIPAKYPLIELLTACLFTVQGYYFGPSFEFIISCILTGSLISISIIDIEHRIIPDEISIPILWFGLNINILQTFTSLEEAVLGATLGYLCLWIFVSIYEKITGKFAMGHGDFKLLALSGAWFGWQQLPFIVLFSSLLASIIGITLIITKHNNRNSEIPFGPYLSIAIWISLIWGDDIMISYYNWLNIG